MNPVAQGLALGYSAQKLIGFLSKAFPTLAPRIKQAQRNGHSVEQVLGFLSKTMETDLPKGTSQQEVLAATNKNKEQLTKHGLTLAASAVAAPLAANADRSVLARALPHALAPQAASLANANNTPNPTSPVPQPSSQSPTGTNPTAQQPQNTSPQPPNPISPNIPNTPQAAQAPLNNPAAASIPEPANIQQPKGFDTNIIKNSIAYKNQIDALISSGNGPEEIEAYLKKFNPGFIKTIEKEGKGPFKDVVAQYMQEKMRDDAVQPEGSFPNEKLTSQPEMAKDSAENAQIEPESEVSQPQIEKIEPAKIEKNSIVSSPDGVGEVREIRGEKALVEIDGKLKKVDVSDLEAPPIPEKDLADLYEDLIKGIEKDTEEDVSRMVQWAGYNPDTNTLQFLPHSGSLYTYDEISPEDAQLLTDVLSVRKTSGSNFIGVWKKDSKSPIGAALSKLIRKLQTERGGKGNEYSAKHETIYSAYEPAVEAKKEKARKKKKK